MMVLWYVLGGIAAVVVLVLIVGAFQPGMFKVERKTAIHAPAERVFGLVNDFRQWAGWSPWEKMDLNMEKTYEGAGGAGATYAWKGNKKVGRGKMTIKESVPNKTIKIRLEFFEPFAADNVAEFSFVETGGATETTWTMTGKKAYMMKVMCMFMNMDKLVGNDFEKGLASMKRMAEGK